MPDECSCLSPPFSAYNYIKLKMTRKKIPGLILCNTNAFNVVSGFVFVKSVE
jgi:hypothetical protein